MNGLIEKDLRHIWHPCSQMKDYETFKPLIVRRASGAYIELADGSKIIDAISSWWCKSLGHGHPHLKQALLDQLEKFEHIIFANTTHEVIVKLSEKLAGLTKTLNKVLYASDGSCAVEIALKMSLHARQITAETERRQFMALSNGYHGETLLALSASDVGIYRDPYKELLIDVHFLKNIPYVNNKSAPLWNDCSACWPFIESELERHAKTLTAIIVEPIVQGAGGMRIYASDFLNRLRRWTKQHNIHLIADEIMTGLGRTGLPLACHHAGIEPDFICLGKGLTGGFLPLSAVLTSDAIYKLFYDDYAKGKSFLHSHTHAGNALAASVALATLNILESENIYQQVAGNETFLAELMQDIALSTNKLTNVRHIGAIAAADLTPAFPEQRLGYMVYQHAVRLGALLRPLGNTIYWSPPLNTDKQTLIKLADITKKALLAA